MRARRADAAVPVGLALASFVIAFAQRPGWASSDTKIDLHVSPGRFLSDVASVWTSSGSLGHVQGGQYGGYLFPMGPFFALGHAVGLGPWVVQRLWLGLLLALGAWGTVRLFDALVGRPRGVAHAVAGAMMVLNPYVVVFTARTSITLLAYAALPWLVLVAHGGVRRSTGWWWPAAFALILTSSGGGVNAAVTAWILVGPALLLLYEPAIGAVAWRDAGRFAWRAAALTLVASLWWIAPVVVQAAYGIDFLKFTEQPGTIWGTTSMSETLRLMGYWVSYIGVGFHGQIRPYFGDGDLLLFKPVILAAGLLVPALALGGFAWTRRRPSASYFLGLVLVGAVIMTAGFPEGTPLRRGLHFTYAHSSAFDFLRTTYKAGPLVALGLAGLGGLGAAELWSRVRRRAPARARLSAAGLVAAGLALLLVSCWPLTRGGGLDDQLLWKRIPSAWKQAGGDLDATLPRNTRATVMPGELFAFYRWGGTIDGILPALTKRPVAERNIVPYADLHAIDLFWTIDGLVSQQRAVPGQLLPLLRLTGASAVVTGSDSDIGRSGAPAPVAAERTLAEQGLGRPTRTFGPTRRLLVPPGEIGPAVALPQVERHDVAGVRGLVRVEPLSAPLVVDGSAAGLAGLAAFGELPARGAIRYAGDLDAAALRRLAAEGSDVVVSDSNRRRVFVSARLEQNAGWTLDGSARPSQDAAILDPFDSRGADAQTVAVVEGVRSLRAPFSPGREQFPEHRPFAALDGSPETAWLGDIFLDGLRQYFDVTFERPRAVRYIDVLRYDDRYGVPTRLEVNGRRFRVRAGWNRLPVRLRRAKRLRVRIAKTYIRRGLHVAAPGGVRELRIPGVHVREALRPPVLAERALRGRDLRRNSITYLFERTTGDEPFRRSRYAGAVSAGRPQDRGDGETAVDRVITPPVARRFEPAAWVSVSPEAPDSALDALTGRPVLPRFDSASRFAGLPGNRASRAFDGDRGTAWIGQRISGAPAWIAWRTAHPLAVRHVRLVPPRETVRFPSAVRLSWDGGRSGVLAVAPDGTVSLPRVARSRRFRLDVVAARFPRPASPQERTRRAVAVAEVQVPGLARASAPPPSAPIAGRCGDVRLVVGGGLARLRATGSARDLDLGRPLRARACSAPVLVPARRTSVREEPGLFRTALVRLRSPAPEPVARAAVMPGRVVDPGKAHNGRYDGVRLSLNAPALLVLGESYNSGWRARCGGRSLGKPQVVDGYANGWRAPAGCRDVDFVFAPQRFVTWAYVASALACLALLALLGLRRDEARVPRLEAPRALEADSPPTRWPLRHAAAAGLVIAAPLAFVFAARSLVVLVPLVAFVLWRGIGARPLALAAGGLLLLEPLEYILFLPSGPGGYNFNYPVTLIDAHWIAVAAAVLLILALARTLAASRSPDPGPVSTAIPPSPVRAPAAAGAPPGRA